MREITSTAELLAATGGAPVVRYDIGDPVGPAWTQDGATVFWRLTQAGDPDLVGLGPAPALARLVRSLLADGRLGGAGGITTDAGGLFDLLGVPDDVDRWAMMTCTSGAGLEDQAPVGVSAVELGAERHEEIRAFLDHHYTSAWTFPGHAPAERWLGYEQDGVLVAVGCCSSTPAGYGRLGGITVDGAARGLGIGRALTTRLTRVGLARRGAVVLGLDEGNPAAEHLYLSLGYRLSHSWWSGRLPRE